MRVVPRRIFARRGVGVIHREIVRLNWQAKRNRRFINPVATRAWNEWNDLCTHAKISQSTIRVSPPIASAIKQAAAAMRASASVQVMIFLEKQNPRAGFRCLRVVAMRRWTYAADLPDVSNGRQHSLKIAKTVSWLSRATGLRMIASKPKKRARPS
ncbi:hypothetical protein [Bradyrhizobium sp.]|uniref:hypothetical protein n=1 Tax=Bradyrhizobium sp. TaxID=376 RepID=UPI0026142D89|nr:hypothetical protein [Bradyrhizobium sp.]